MRFASADAPRRLGTTLDDAAGEAFDKGARLLGLGYPGGSGDRRDRGRGRSGGVPVPRRAGAGSRLLVLGAEDGAPLHRSRARRRRGASADDSDLAASYQQAIVRALTARLREGAEQTGLERLAVVGGVSANSALRAALPDARFAPLQLCTDNAAMIASAARYLEPSPYPSYLGLDVVCVGCLEPSGSLALALLLGADRGRPRAGDSAPVARRGRVAGRARRACGRLHGAALRRAAGGAVARRSSPRARRTGDGGADARLDQVGGRRAGAVPRPHVGCRSARRARLSLRPGAERVLDPARPDLARTRAPPTARCRRSTRFGPRFLPRPPRRWM